MILCPTCQNELEVYKRLREDSADEYDYTVNHIGHEQCDQLRILRTVRRSLKTPRPRNHGTDAPREKTDRSLINKNNRKRGKRAEDEWAQIIHGRRVGLLGREDVDDGLRLFEVKARKLPAWIKEAYVQVRKHPGDQLRYVVIKSVLPGKAADWWVLQTAEQFIDVNGLGSVEPRKGKGMR